TCQYLRDAREWSLVRVDTHRSGREQIGLIPSAYLVPKSLYNAHIKLFDDPGWYLGDQSFKAASDYLYHPMQPKPAREGAFVIFSPQPLNLDPLDHKCFLILILIPKSSEELWKILGAECSAQHDSARDYAFQSDRAILDDHIAQGLRYLRCPLIEKVLPITRDPSGAYIFLENRYETLFDLVWDGATNPRAVFKLAYDALDPKLRPSHIGAAVEAPPISGRNARRLPMPMEQMSVVYNHRNLPGDVLGYATKTTLDPKSGACQALMKPNGGLSEGAMKKLQEHKFKEKKEEEGGKKKKDHVDVQLKLHRNLFIDDRNLRVDKDRPLGKGEFGVVYAGKLSIQLSAEFVEIGGEKVNRKRSNERLIKSKEKERQRAGLDGALEQPPSDGMAKNEVVQRPETHELLKNSGKEQFDASEVEVAVKCIPCKIQNRAAWMNEVAALQETLHPNIVRFYGCSINFEPQKVALITELVKGGSLDKILQKVTPETALTSNDCADLLGQIARGMSYLHCLEPSIVHGDLAARNILLTPHPIDQSRLIAKVTDFGLSKMMWPSECATYDDQKKLPIAWEPPEVHRGRELSVHTDVWMFGVLAIEFFVSANGGTPFGPNAVKVPYMFKEGYRHERPRHLRVPEFVWSAIVKCWEYDPTM
ncbi:hypothetical protein PENTCL1PPCAC_11874, partial [Pristionchus entomophagus]